VARLALTLQTLARLTLPRMTRTRAQLTLARLTLTRQTLIRLTLTRLTLARLTLSGLALARLTLAWLARMTRILTLARLTLVRLTLARMTRIFVATTGASTITTTASIAAVNNASAAGPEFGVATDSRAFAVIVCFAVAASIAIVAASAHTDVISTIIAGTASAPINNGDRAISAAQITLKAKASTIFPRPEEEQSTAALIPLNCNYAVELTEHVRRQFQAIPSTSATLTADGSVTAVLNFKVIQVTFITVAVVGAYNLGCSAADNPCSAIAVHYACTAFENT